MRAGKRQHTGLSQQVVGCTGLCLPLHPTSTSALLTVHALAATLPPLCRFGPHLQGINGGMLLLRPCKAVMRHMLAVLEAQPKLRFSHGAAEQDFFHW